MFKGCLALFSSILLVGCASKFAKSYTDHLDGVPIHEHKVLIPHTGEPTLERGKHTEHTVLDMLENGWAMVGRSAFSSSVPYRDYEVLNQARKVSAAHVLVSKDYSHSRGGSVAISTYNHWTYTASTFVIPYTVNYHLIVATYWVRTREGPLGAFVQDLTRERRTEIERNKGAEVYAVRRGSPAFEANIVGKDVFVKVAGEIVENAHSFYKLIEKHAGADIELSILRKGRELTKRVRLGVANVR